MLLTSLPHVWSFEKLFWGLIPTVAGIALFVRIGRRWSRLFRQRYKAWLAGGVALMVAACVDLLLLQRLLWYEDLRPPVWSAENLLFDWGRATVTLPPGCRYERAQGIDTFVGEFLCDEGRVVIHHDIGELAVGHGGFVRDRETLVRGSRVWTAHADYAGEDGHRVYVGVVSFPDHGCAKFSVGSNNPGDLAHLDQIVTSYSPKGWIPSWMLPLLPEVLRSECRQW